MENLSVERQLWPIQVRALRVWKQPNYGKDLGFGDCLEIVVVDQWVRNSIFQYSTNWSFLLSQLHLHIFQHKFALLQIEVFLGPNFISTFPSTKLLYQSKFFFWPNFISRFPWQQIVTYNISRVPNFYCGAVCFLFQFLPSTIVFIVWVLIMDLISWW